MFKKGIGISSTSVGSIDTVKQLVYPVIACLGILGCVVFHSAPEALSAECKTFSIHDPIYPVAGENVTYTLLDVIADNGVQSITLSETVYHVNPDGSLGTGTTGTLYTWPNLPLLPVSYEKVGGNTSNKFIQYKFEVIDNGGNPYPNPNIVSYAIDPYPPSTAAGGYQPAPVYAQGDIGQAMDIVFIPDVDITVMVTFRNHCRLMILEGIFADEMTRSFWKYFNFYINPRRGKTRASGSETPTPDNWSQLSFAEGHAIMHETDFPDDYAIGTLFTTEQESRGTMLHEAGHALFGLADEYPGGGHWQLADYTNNWNNRSDARSEAPLRHRRQKDVKKIRRINWYKICYTNCQMRYAGLNAIGYDLPCQDRVEFAIQDNAATP